MSDRQLIEDLLSALEYHTEQTRPIEFSKVAIEVAHEHLRKPAQQEPVAWMHPDGRIWTFGRGLDKSTFTVPLYTSPPAQQEQGELRTWVGLTDEEITDIWAEASPYYHEDDFARAIEAKLKEKNT